MLQVHRLHVVQTWFEGISRVNNRIRCCISPAGCDTCRMWYVQDVGLKNNKYNVKSCKNVGVWMCWPWAQDIRVTKVLTTDLLAVLWVSLKPVLVCLMKTMLKFDSVWARTFLKLLSCPPVKRHQRERILIGSRPIWIGVITAILT